MRTIIDKRRHTVDENHWMTALQRRVAMAQIYADHLNDETWPCGALCIDFARDEDGFKKRDEDGNLIFTRRICVGMRETVKVKCRIRIWRYYIPDLEYFLISDWCPLCKSRGGGIGYGPSIIEYNAHQEKHEAEYLELRRKEFAAMRDTGEIPF